MQYPNVDVNFKTGAVTGTLKYFTEPGPIVDYWGEGYFFAFKIVNEDERSVSTILELDPSEGSGPVDIHGDPDMNGIVKIADPSVQKFKVTQVDAEGHTNVQIFDLTGLRLEGANAATWEQLNSKSWNEVKQKTWGEWKDLGE